MLPLLDPLVQAAQLRAFISRLRRLQPLNHDPERFHVEKSELEHDLERAARELEAEGRFVNASGLTHRVGLGTSTIKVRGRQIPVVARRPRPGTLRLPPR